MRARALLIDPLGRSWLDHSSGLVAGKNSENECPQHGILRDANAEGKNLARKQRSRSFPGGGLAAYQATLGL